LCHKERCEKHFADAISAHLRPTDVANFVLVPDCRRLYPQYGSANNYTGSLRKQFPNPLILNSHMQVRRRDRHIRVPRRVPHLGQRPLSRQRMAYERVPPMVNGQRLQPV